MGKPYADDLRLVVVRLIEIARLLVPREGA